MGELPLPEHPSQERARRFDLLVGLGHQLHGLLLFAGVVHGSVGLKAGRYSAAGREDVSTGADAEGGWRSSSAGRDTELSMTQWHRLQEKTVITTG